ncbi:hypothetical protein GCM10022215_15170 [Nocardioides fonticola]|uniref:Uncharacterized protein n=1 Tax=Nocardioides fonticola TaxID=450363 RepID=A0ABP7XIZ5_9ACTN
MTTTTCLPTPLISLQMEFARALSPRDDTVYPVTATNGLLIGRRWTEADHAAPYAVRIGYEKRFYALALDFDAGHDSMHAEQADRDARDAYDLLTDLGINCVLIESGPTGGRHVQATIEGGVKPWVVARIMNGLKRIDFPTLDPSPMRNVKTGAIRPVGSPHRAGRFSYPLSHDPKDALAVLECRNEPRRVELLAAALPHERRDPLRVPAGEDAPGKAVSEPKNTYRSGSEEVAAEATKVLNAGGTEDDFRRAMGARKDGPDAVGECLQKHAARGDLASWLARTWRRQAAFVRENPPIRSVAAADDRAVIAAWEIAVGQIPEPGARRAAQALLTSASAQGRALVGMSVRDLAERAGLTRGSAQRALTALRADGMLEIAGEAVGGQATRYRLVHPDAWRCDTGGTVSPTAVGGVGLLTVPGMSQVVELARDVSLDLWRQGGLGEGGRRALEALSRGHEGSEEVPIAILPDVLGRSRRTVERTLGDLAAVGLARKIRSGVWVAEYRDPDRVAEQLGVAGAGEDLQRRNASERRQERLKQAKRRAQYLLTQDKWRDLSAGAVGRGASTDRDQALAVA